MTTSYKSRRANTRTGNNTAKVIASFPMPSNGFMTIQGMVHAVQDDDGSKRISYQVFFAARRVAGTITVETSPTFPVIPTDGGAAESWTGVVVTAVAQGNKEVAVEVTGLNSPSIDWACDLNAMVTTIP